VQFNLAPKPAAGVPVEDDSSSKAFGVEVFAVFLETLNVFAPIAI
jgi:hypothetical protein